MTRVMVTGAAGFIGSHLCETLVRSGHDVVGLDCFTPFYDEQAKRTNIGTLVESPRFALVEADLRTVALEPLLETVDAVAHLAGQPGVTTSWGSAFQPYVEGNVLATQRLLEAVVRCPVDRLVYASSSSVYGRPASDQLGLRPSSPYGVTKLAAEQLVGAYAEAFGVRAVSLRYFSVYGPRQRPDMAVHRFVEAMLDGRPVTVFGDGQQVRDVTYVSDVVDATARALSTDLSPGLPNGLVVDVAGGSPVTVTALIDELRDVVGVSQPRRECANQRPGDVQRTQGRLEPARAYLGWFPRTDLRTGLTHQVAWHRSQRLEHHAAGHPCGGRHAARGQKARS